MNQEILVKQLFKNKFNDVANVFCHAPGRVNIIGDHTDYNDGFVFPAAIDFGTNIAASKRDDLEVHVYAHDCDAQSTSFTLNEFEFDQNKMWSNYVQGTLQALMTEFPHIKGANFAVTGNVPQGAGLSSSASFEIAILKTFADLYKLKLDGVMAAKLGQMAENNFVGCNCGIMDQLISAMGEKGQAMLLDCQNLSFEYAPIPKDVSILIVNSNVKRGLVDSEYNLRREQCDQVANYFGKPSLRGVTMAQLDSAQSQLATDLYKRARHVISENERTVAALEALKNNDLATMSALMQASHNSLRDDFEVTTKEMDGLVELIAQEIGSKGGVRMTGGGFGGCIVALMPNNMTEQVSAVVRDQYPKKYGIEPSIYICKASDGAFV